MTHLGIKIYHRALHTPTRVLTQALLPLVDGWRQDNPSIRFWYTFYDSRGPHIFALLSVPNALTEVVRARIDERLSRHLLEKPLATAVSEEEVKKRHQACRGNILCPIDREPGLARPNSFALFEQPSSGYPFSVLGDPAGNDDLWRQCDRLCTWTLKQLSRGRGTGAAIRWIAAVDRALHNAALDAKAYWRREVEALLPGLAEQPGWDTRALTPFTDALGSANHRLFSSLWDQEPSPEMPDPLTLIGLLPSGAEFDLDLRFGPLREINHLALLQLGQAVRAHIPLVLYAYARNHHA
jgi:hypothetical protein